MGIVTLCWAQLTNTSTNAPALSKSLRRDTPNGNTIVIISNGKSWTINELNQKALQHLWEKGSMPKGLDVESSVRLYPHDKRTMCEFLYFQGFGRPSWNVKLGFDGVVTGFDKRTAMERQQ